MGARRRRAAVAVQRALACSFLVACLAATLLPSVLASCQGNTSLYQFTFVGQWTATNQPGLCPDGAGFSRLFMATHSSDISLFLVGEPITFPGLKGFLSSPSGNTSETLLALAQSHSDTIEDVDASGELNATASGELNATASYTVLLGASNFYREFSTIAKLLPSSDWFVGVSGYDLCSNDDWEVNGTIPLTVYDAGLKNSTLSFNDSGLASATPEAVSVLGVTFPVAPAYISFQLVHAAPEAPEEAPAPSNGAFMLVVASTYLLATLLTVLVLALN